MSAPNRPVRGRKVLSAPRFKAEADLGPHVIAWLEGEGFDVYQEVQAWAGIADLVGTSGPQLIVVEMKLALSFELLYQAVRWRSVAHSVWVAVPHGIPSMGRATAIQCFGDRGIGIVQVKAHVDGGEIEPRRDVLVRPAFNRHVDSNNVRRFLRGEHKTFALAGSAGGRNWSQFKATCGVLRTYLAKNPGATIAEVVKDVEHHYASDAGARSRLVDLIERGLIKGVRIERSGKAVRLFPVPEAGAA